MSSDKYRSIWDKMTPRQRDVMWELWMQATNHDGHAWVTFGQVEDAVAELLSEETDETD